MTLRLSRRQLQGYLSTNSYVLFMLLFTGSAVQGWVFLQNPRRSLNPRNSDDDPKSGFACSGSTLQNHSLRLWLSVGEWNMEYTPTTVCWAYRAVCLAYTWLSASGMAKNRSRIIPFSRTTWRRRGDIGRYSPSGIEPGGKGNSVSRQNGVIEDHSKFKFTHHVTRPTVTLRIKNILY